MQRHRGRPIIPYSRDHYRPLHLYSDEPMDFTFYPCHRAALGLTLALVLPGPARPQFTDQTGAAGIAFQYVAGGQVKKHIVETSGGGAAFFDYDRDGDLDLYAVNGATVDTYRQKSGPGNVLYRNQGDGTFADMAAPAGVDDRGWGMGSTAGDVDGDGYRDLYVTNYGANILYRNRGDGTFEDISTPVAGADYSSSAAFFDYDKDGDLDLYVANYLVYDFDSPPDKICTYEGIEIFCGPQGLPGAPDLFYRNDGNYTFTDVTRPSGISWANRYYGLGVLPEDFDNDGDTDILVANDATPNVLFNNNSDGTFTEMGLKAGIAYNEYGEEEAGMGISGGDFDADGDLDLYITHFFRESNTFYRNDGQGFFKDITAQAGLEGPTLAMLGWGTQFFDYDKDGDLDLFVANGHVYPQVDGAIANTSYPQRNQLFGNRGADRLVDMGTAAGPGFDLKRVSRGASFGDYDNDGDMDIFVVNLDEAATLLRNDFAPASNWLVVQLFGRAPNHYAIGAKVRLLVGDRPQWRTVNGASSYLSYNDTRLFFGLAGGEGADQVDITWPDGSRQTVPAVPANKLLVVHQDNTYTSMEMGDNPYAE